MVLGAVLITAASVAAFEGPTTAGGCSVCSTMAGCPAMGSVKSEFVNLQNGVAQILTVTDPAKVEGFHQTWDRAQTEIGKSLKLSREEAKSHLCSMCQGYYDLCKQGAHPEFAKTETGLLLLITAKKPKVVRAIQEQAAKEREMMTKKEPCCESPSSP
jgi:hypothetical protein